MLMGGQSGLMGDKDREFSADGAFEDIGFNGLVAPIEQSGVPGNIVRNVASEGEAARAGEQTRSLQRAMDSYQDVINKRAIAKSTGEPVRTSTAQFKGFIAEEYQKITAKINALAAGVPDYAVGIYTGGEMQADGTRFSGIDMQKDVTAFIRDHPWSREFRTHSWQSKIHNDADAYRADFAVERYQDVEVVGAAGQGVNDKAHLRYRKTDFTSDSKTTSEYAEMTDRAKDQATLPYERRSEKLDELDGVNLRASVKAGAISGLILSSIREIQGIIRKSERPTRKQFVESVEHVLCETIEGGMRAGVISESIHLLGKTLNKEISSGSIEAIPAMAGASVMVDLAKDLYRCFFEGSIDADKLLCNTVNNTFTSVAGCLGGAAGGRAGAKAFRLLTAKESIATGAAIGSPLGPIGIILGSVIGSAIINIGASALISTANEDAWSAYCRCVDDVNAQVELEGVDRAYYFADTMASLSEFRPSFRCLLPCYNLISDLSEYNLHKKAMSEYGDRLDAGLEVLDDQMRDKARERKRVYRARMLELRESFKAQRVLLEDDYRETLNTYIANSYEQYFCVSEIITSNARELAEELERRRTEHSYVLDYMRHCNKVERYLNDVLDELMQYKEDKELLSPFIKLIEDYMCDAHQNGLLVGRQYVSYDEALSLMRERGAA